jgi:DNA polymerase III alpha subunit
MLTEIKAIKTKRGDQMGKAVLVDQDEKVELTFFPEVWGANRSKIKLRNIVEILGLKSSFGGKHNQVQVTDVTVIE